MSEKILPSIPKFEKRQMLSTDIINNNRSYVNRASRFSTGQKNAFNIGMQKFGLEFSTECCLSKLLAEKKPYHRTILDIGFGEGAVLINMAKQNPQDLFVGIETYKPGIGAMFVQSLKLNINNIYVFHNDAQPILFYMIEDNSIDRIQIFFPDPWPKTRHNKRRLIQINFLMLCWHLLKPQSCIWIVTDCQDYALQIEQSFIELNTHNTYFIKDENLTDSLEATRVSTRYEQKGIRKGHQIYPSVHLKKLPQNAKISK